MSAPRPLYIFDLDGTLSLSHHRAHYLGNRDDPARWDKFYEACDQDPPNEPVLAIFLALAPVADRVIFTGRSNSVREKTLRWFEQHAGPDALDGVALRMRRVGDHSEDVDLKRRWFEDMALADRVRLLGVFEDRARVVAMWRELDVACFQVADGDF